MKHEIMISAPEPVKNFLVYSETIKEKSSKSVEEYYFDLQTFFRYLLLSKGLVSPETEFSQIDISGIDIEFIKTITLNDIHMFLAYCKTDRNNNATTRARKSSTIRIFFKYLCNKTHQLETNPAELLETPKTRQTLPKHLTLDDSIELLNSVTGNNATRDYCILTLFLNCGLRLSELVGLNVTDVKSDNSLRVLGKGNKERIVYLNSACVNAINEYLKVRPNEGIVATDKNALFISRNKRRISNKTVQHLVKNYIEKAGLGGQGLSTHKLRHTAATLMYQQGNVDIRILKEILGHANLGTTQIYTHVSNNQIENALNANPLANIKKKDNNNENSHD